MNEDNPFAVSESCRGTRDELPPVTVPSCGYLADGNRIICGESVQLPPVCVMTGRTQDLSAVTDILTSSQSFRITTKEVHVTCNYFLASELHRRRKTALLIGRVVFGIGLLHGCFATPVMAAYSSAGLAHWWAPLTGLAVIVAIPMLWLSRCRLHVSRADTSGHFQIEGFSPAFFQSLQLYGPKS